MTASPGRAAVLLLLALGTSGCGSHSLNPFEIRTTPVTPPPQALRYPPSQLPRMEYWTGIVMLGDKVGFSRLRLEPAAGGYLVEAEAAMNFRILGYSKSIHLHSRDWVDEQLRLRRFQYEYRTDGNVQTQVGEVRDGLLHARVRNSAGEVELLEDPQGASLYPDSVLNIYPLLQGLEVGAAYDYLVYDSQRHKLARVQQQVTAYETSDLFQGPAYKLHTRMGFSPVRTWINGEGLPVLEISADNLFIAGLESEARARRYLAQGALSKKESLVDFSLVRSDRRLYGPRRLRRLELELLGLGDFPLPARTARQQCEAGSKPGRAVCRIQVAPGPLPGKVRGPDPERHLARTLQVPTNHPAILRLAEEIGGDAWPVPALVNWLQDNIKREIIDSYTALDVLERRAGECQGHSYLYTALARSLGVPTRIVNGLVYSEQHRGFLYHTWAESWDGAAWRAADPTFGQEHADATHVVLLEGETPDELAPLMQLFGRLEARILDYGSTARKSGLAAAARAPGHRRGRSAFQPAARSRCRASSWRFPGQFPRQSPGRLNG